MANRRWAIVAGLAVVELWIVGLMLRSLAGNHRPDASAPMPPSAFASAGPATAGRAQTVQTGPAPSVIIDDENANLVVTVRRGGSVDVHDRSLRRGWVHGDEAPLEIAKTADGVRIARASGGMVFMFGGSLEHQLDVIVPPDSRLDVRNAATTIVTGLRADASLHSDDGSIAIRDHRGKLHATTDNGRIELTDVVTPFVEARSDNGRISFNRVRADGLDVTTDNGRVEIVRSLVRGGRIHTDNGRVELGLDPQSDVTVSARTSSGKVSALAPLTVTSPDSQDEDGPSTVRVGSGTGQLDVQSSDGSISITTAGVEG